MDTRTLAMVFSATFAAGAAFSQSDGGIPVPDQTITASAAVAPSFADALSGPVDRVVISQYRRMPDKKPAKTATLSAKGEIAALTAPLLRLPAKGDIYKKLAPTVSFVKVEFFRSGESLAVAKIYGGSLAMPDTAFLSGPSADEGAFVAMVGEALENGFVKLDAGQRLALVATLVEKINASADGRFTHGRHSFGRMDSDRLWLARGKNRKAILDSGGIVRSIVISGRVNRRETVAAEKLLRELYGEWF